MSSYGSYKNRDTVIIALNRALERSDEYFWDDIIDSYIEICKNNNYQYKHIKQLLNITDNVSAIYTTTHRYTKIDQWYHATFYAVVNGKCYLFNHYRLFIEISESYFPISSDSEQIIVNINKKSNLSFSSLVKLALGHWYRTNYLSRLTSWPTSCTGFTDFLLYCTYGENILEYCPLSYMKKKSLPVFTKKGIILLNTESTTILN